MNSTPSRISEDRPVLAADEARALFESARGVENETGETCDLAIVGKNGDILYAAPGATRLIGVKDRADLQRALGCGESPNARRLRHLAGTLPIGGPPRLERIRFSLGRLSTTINVLCARASDPRGGTALALSVHAPEKEEVAAGQVPCPVAFGAPAGEPIHADPGASVDPVAVRVGRAQQPVEGQAPFETPYGASLHARSRFLWTLDAEGRFGAPDPLLIAALGASAPQPGETLERLVRREEIEHSEELEAMIEKRETFSGLVLVWRGKGEDRKLPLTLSAAPTFDSRRGFAGYRGFGVFDEGIGAGHAADAAPDQSGPAPSECEPPPVGSADSGVVRAIEAIAQGGAPLSGLESENEEAAEDPIILAQAGAPDAASVYLDDAESDGGETAPGRAENADGQTTQPGPPQERTAAIYFLRQAGASPSKIVPIRPGAIEALSLREAAQGDGEYVELSRSERDAFREIARALVGRAPAFHPDEETEPATPAADADDRPDAPSGSIPTLPPAEGESGFDQLALRNAMGLLDRLPVGVLVARDARVLYLNRTLLDLLGYRDFEHFDGANGLAMMFRGHDPESVSVEDRSALSIVKADGGTLAVEGHALAVFWDDAPATLFSLRPSTEAELEEKLCRTEREPKEPIGSSLDLQQMLDRATDGAVILDAAGRILSFNQSAERLFGYQQREVLGESVLMLFAPQSHPEATAALDQISRADEAPEPERPLAVVGRNRDGSALTLALTLARIGSPETFSYCALVRDTSREREAEARLVAARDAALAASAAKTDFLAQVSHEIRTPLSAVLGFAEAMMEERFGPIGNERYRDYLKDIHASGKHVMSLADDLLDLSKIESGKLELAFAPVDANSVIRECVSLMQPQAARERVILRVSLYERLPHVMVDQRSLKQVMLNLMSNAVKFNEPGGQVIVSTAVDAGGQAVIRVRDTGMGMSESEVGLALEPFAQIGRAGRKGGVGLGLPLTKALVEANKAEFSIKSRREQGTLIEIAFPVVQAAQ